jgi:hypothetical protein
VQTLQFFAQRRRDEKRLTDAERPEMPEAFFSLFERCSVEEAQCGVACDSSRPQCKSDGRLSERIGDMGFGDSTVSPL